MRPYPEWGDAGGGRSREQRASRAFTQLAGSGGEFQHTRGGWKGLGLMRAHRELGAGVRAVIVLGSPWNKVSVPVL